MKRLLIETAHEITYVLQFFFSAACGWGVGYLVSKAIGGAATTWRIWFVIVCGVAAMLAVFTAFDIAEHR